MERHFERMFLVAAWHNYLGGLGFILLYSWVYTYSGSTPPVPGVHYQTWIGLIFLFGWIYQQAGRDLEHNRTLVIIGIAGKIISASPMCYGLLTGNDAVPKLFGIAVLTDFTFAALFVWFYRYATSSGLWGQARPSS